jgi:hypothetical protein
MLYENMYIGSFIYTLGVIAGMTSNNISDSVNLFQQTPYDIPFDDLVADWQGKKFIIEFKRNLKGLKEEIQKPTTSGLYQVLTIPEERELKYVADQCHFLGCGNGEKEIVTIDFCRYLHFHKETEPRIDLENFVRRLLDPESTFGISDSKAFTKYIGLLSRVYQEATKSGSTGGRNVVKYMQVSAVIVNISTTQPNRYIPISSMGDLRIDLGQQIIEGIVTTHRGYGMVK